MTIEVPSPADPVAGGELRGGPMGLRPSREAIDGGELPAGRNTALTALFAAYYRRLVGLARLLVDDQAGAEDVVQDAFLALSRRWGKLRDPVTAYAYLQRSVVNGARSRLRRSYLRQRLHLVPSPDEPSAESTALDREQVSQVRALIGELSGRQREVLVLRYYLDLSEAQIAGLLGISTGSVKQHASRAISRLAAFGGSAVSGERHDQVVAHLRAAFQQDADLAMARADVGSAFVDFGARLRKDRQYRAVRAIAACLALLAALAAAIGIMHGLYHQPRVTRPPASDPGGPRLNDPNASVPRPEQAFTGQGRHYLAQGFGPEFSFVEPPAPWRIAGPGTSEGLSYEMGRTERGALYLVRGEPNHSTQRLTFLVWRNVLDDHLRPSPTPPQLASWLTANRHLGNVSQQPDTVSGMTAVRVDAAVVSTPAYGSTRYCNAPLIECLLLADNAEHSRESSKIGLYGGRVGPRAAYLERGALVRFWIVPLSNGERLVIQASAQPAEFDAFIDEADQIVKSLVIAR